MKVLITLFVAFILSCGISKIATGDWQLVFSGNLAMFVMLCLTSIGHFKFTKGMTMMMPPFIPFKKAFVYITGIAEIVLGAALLHAPYRNIAGTILIILFVFMLPANIYAAIKHINLEKGTYDGSGIGYLWFRIPMQVLLIAWVWYFSVRG